MPDDKFMERRPIFWAGGFLFDVDERKVLLHLRDGKTLFNPNKWAFFGGLNEGQETFGECFVRELQEEIGLSVKRTEVTYLLDYSQPDMAAHRVVFYVRSSTPIAKLILGEGVEFRWIELDAVGEYDLTKRTREDLVVFLTRAAA